MNFNKTDIKVELPYDDVLPDHYVYIWDFECAGDEVLVESTPPASPPPTMAASIAGPTQGAGGEASPGEVGDIIVIPEIANTIQLQHTIQQVQSTVDVNGDSSGHSSPTVDGQHTYITVSSALGEDGSVWIGPVKLKSEPMSSDQESEGGTSVNYHVQYVDPQEIYTQPHEHQPHIENLRTFPVYTAGTAPSDTWGAEFSFGVVADEADTAASPATPAQPPRMAPATVQWLLDNYETAEGVSLPRSTLYAHYLRHCNTHHLDPVNAASFGKLIRSVFVGLRTRRLGTRGNSKYHYYGIRAKTTASDSPPTAQECSLEDKQQLLAQEGQDGDAAESAGTVGGAVGPHRQYLGSVTPPEPPVLCVTEMPPECLVEHLNALHRHHKEHGVQFLEAVAALDTASVERSRRAFWKRPPPGLCRKILYRLAHNKDVVAWLKKAELALYQKAVELLLPDVLRPIPSQLTQSIRNFAKSVEAALSAGCAGAPPPAARAHLAAAAAMAGALRRYTSLNHLAQAARAVLHNHTQAHQMLSDLNRVDFRVVHEQASWACACASPKTALALEQDFKATLGRGATLEQWASWLESCVKKALAPHEKKPEFSSRARRLLLDWSFFSSLVIRELTLRSAASFGSFHLIRLLFDEYVAYLVEKKVAAHEIAPSIAIMHPVDDEFYIEDENKTELEEEEGEWDWDEDEEDEIDAKKAKLE